MHRKKRRYKKYSRRPIILIDSEQLNTWGFLVGLGAAFIDLAVLIVLVYWLHIDMALKVGR